MDPVMPDIDDLKRFKSMDIEDMKMEEMQRVSSRPRSSTLFKKNKDNAFDINYDGI